ncbi:MAG: CheR family methyltransferase [Acidobacteriota bacterium]
MTKPLPPKKGIPLSVSPDLRARISELVSEHLGLYFPPDRWTDLERGLAAVAKKLGVHDVAAFIVSLASQAWSQTDLELLAEHLTVGETHFFRDRNVFQALEQEILPSLLRERAKSHRQLRIWSAGCSSGEEAYSIAILLDTLLPDWDSWKVTIVATDVNPRALRKAAAGVYHAWALREVPTKILERYFKPRGKGYFQLDPGIRRKVLFVRHNLVLDAYPPPDSGVKVMDLILCRNVLMYLRSDLVDGALQRFYNCLGDDGWFSVAACETHLLRSSAFAPVHLEGITFYRKFKDQRHSPPTPPRRHVQQTLLAPLEMEPVLTPIPPVETTTAEVPQPLEEASPVVEAGAVAEDPAASLVVELTRLAEEGRWEDVVAASRKLDPDDLESAKVAALVAHAFASLGELREAQAWCEKAIALDKLDPAVHYLQATIYEEQGNLEEAAQALGRALYLDPNFVLAHFALANLERRRGRSQAAARHFEATRLLLQRLDPQAVLPGSDGLTAARLAELVAALTNTKPAGDTEAVQ